MKTVEVKSPSSPILPPTIDNLHSDYQTTYTAPDDLLFTKRRI